MSLLDAGLQIFAYSLIVVPVAILIIGVILFFYMPIHRQTVGIILVALGSFGLAINSVSFYIAVTVGSTSMLYLALVLVEVMIIITGIVSLTHTKPKQPIFS